MAAAHQSLIVQHGSGPPRGSCPQILRWPVSWQLPTNPFGALVPQVTFQAVDYVQLSPTAHVSDPGAVPPTWQQPPLILLLDATLPPHQLHVLLTSLEVVLPTLPDTLPVGLITFGTAAEVHVLDPSAPLPQSYFIPGATSPSQADVSVILDQARPYLAPLKTAAAPLLRAARSCLGTPRLLGGPRPTARCAGVALEVALNMVVSQFAGSRAGEMARAFAAR